MNELHLKGCRVQPLAHYLKALGILRIVAEQADPQVRGAWRNDSFILKTKLSMTELESFFLDDYCPTPIVAPWNGGSGFNPKDNQDAILRIEKSDDDRFDSYKATISAARNSRTFLAIKDKVSKDKKDALLELCRASFPDAALPWLDAAVVLTADKSQYPPLLGTGGNDGRLDFTNNFMQRLLEVLEGGQEQSLSLLRSSLIQHATSDLQKKSAIGQFMPSAAGGANLETGFDSESLINSWDFVLMLEGATSFASSLTKRGQAATGGALAYPFTVRSSAAGYGSAAENDIENSRAEMWLPIWERFASSSEIRTLMSEGRAQLGGRQAVTGVDFARAVATLGVDRGISQFQRIGFQVRNGLAYLATPLGRVSVGERPRVHLLNTIDPWLERAFMAARDKLAPASFGRACRNLQASIMALCQQDDSMHLQECLVNLGAVEQCLANSLTWTKDRFLRPLPMLSVQWAEQLDWQQPELRLAASLASLYPLRSLTGKKEEPLLPGLFRQHLEPVAPVQLHSKFLQWKKHTPDNDVTWRGGDIVSRMIATMSRRLMRAGQDGYSVMPDIASVPATLDDVSLFLSGEIDEKKLGELVVALSIVDFRNFDNPINYDKPTRQPGTYYQLLKLCFSPPLGGPLEDSLPPIRLNPTIYRQASAGNSEAAWPSAERRLRGSGYVPLVPKVVVSQALSRRTAAALLFPLRPKYIAQMANELRPNFLSTTPKTQDTAQQGKKQ